MNQCIFSGRLTKDAETKTTQSGMSITNFTLAVDCGFGEKKRTEFLSCKAFKKDALAPYLVKGKAILVQAEYQEDRWEKDGQKHSRPTWICNGIEFQQGSAGGQAQTQAPPAQPYNANDDMDTAPF